MNTALSTALALVDATIKDNTSGDVRPSQVAAALRKIIEGVAGLGIADIAALAAALDGKVPLSGANLPNGYLKLDGTGKIPLGLAPPSETFVGKWDANANSPTLADNQVPFPTPGSYYTVETSGSTSLGGVSDWIVGDRVQSNGTAWTRIPAIGGVATGVVVDAPAGETFGNAQAYLDFLLDLSGQKASIVLVQQIAAAILNTVEAQKADKTDLAAKLDAAYATFSDDAAALAGIPAGRFGVAKKGGRLSLYANDGGTLVDLLAPATF